MTLHANLYQEAGGWGLPSTCPSCIAANATLRIAGADVEVEPGTASPAMTQTGQLPVVVLEPEGEDHIVLAGLHAVRTHSSVKADKGLTKVQIAESAAFIAMIESALAPVRLYEWFQLEDNYLSVVRPAYVGHLSFPLSVFASRTRRNQARTELGLFDPDTLYSNASECLQSLSIRLGDRKPFFYGDNPTVLDAVLYGYLALAIFTPLLESRFKELLADYPNLIQATKAFGAIVFPAETLNVEENDPNKAESRSKRSIPRTAAEAAARAAQGGEKASTQPTATPEEQIREQRNRLFILITVGSFLGYALFGTELEFEGLEFDTT